MADPHLTYPTMPGSGEVYVKGLTDISKLFPREWRVDSEAPIRDAIATGLMTALQELQAANGYSSAQSDPLRSTDRYLLGLADDRGFVPAPGEGEEEFRDRISDTPALVTYDAIVALVNSIIAPHSAILPRVFDAALDGLFISDDSGGFHSYIGAPPDYPDRLYPHHADVNDGVSLPQSHPTGAWVFADTVGRYFVVVVPDISPSDADLTYLSASGETDAFYIGDGTDPAYLPYVLIDFQTALNVYQAIVNAVERISGQGVRWQLYADPDLT